MMRPGHHAPVCTCTVATHLFAPVQHPPSMLSQAGPPALFVQVRQLKARGCEGGPTPPLFGPYPRHAAVLRLALANCGHSRAVLAGLDPGRAHSCLIVEMWTHCALAAAAGGTASCSLTATRCRCRCQCSDPLAGIRHRRA